LHSLEPIVVSTCSSNGPLGLEGLEACWRRGADRPKLQRGNAGYMFVEVTFRGFAQHGFSKANAIDPLPRAVRALERLQTWAESYSDHHQDDVMRPLVNIRSRQSTDQTAPTSGQGGGAEPLLRRCREASIADVAKELAGLAHGQDAGDAIHGGPTRACGPGLIAAQFLAFAVAYSERFEGDLRGRHQRQPTQIVERYPGNACGDRLICCLCCER
jgi:acetylornithine deacetylase/succinyl-diaminopimelate desuccinylase-like protein